MINNLLNRTDVGLLKDKLIVEIFLRENNKNLLNKFILKTLKNQLKRVKEYDDIINIKKYKLAFIGSIGTGKSTAICHLFDLTYKDNKGFPIEILKTASGRTTVCETLIKIGEQSKIVIEPQNKSEIEKNITNFINLIKRKLNIKIDEDIKDENTLPSKQDEFSAEMERAIRNTLNLKLKIENNQIVGDEAVDFYLNEEKKYIPNNLIFDKYNKFKTKYETLFNQIINIKNGVTETEKEIIKANDIENIFYENNEYDSKLLNLFERTYWNKQLVISDIKNSCIEIINKLQSINSLNENGESLLFIMLKNENNEKTVELMVDIAKTILEKGFDLNIMYSFYSENCGCYIETLVSEMLREGIDRISGKGYEFAKLLFKFGADYKNKTDSQNRNAIDYSILKSDEKTALFFENLYKKYSDSFEYNEFETDLLNNYNIDSNLIENFKNEFNDVFNTDFCDFLEYFEGTCLSDIENHEIYNIFESFEKKLTKNLFERIDFNKKNKHELIYDNITDELKWIRYNFDKINDGEHCDFMIPKKIYITVNQDLVKNELFEYKQIIDTKGLDNNKNRQDIDEYLKRNDTLCIFTSKFNDAPETNIINFLEYHSNNISKYNHFKLILLGLPRKLEPEQSNDANGNYELGIDLRKDIIQNVFISKNITFLPENILFFSPFKYYIKGNRGNITGYDTEEDDDEQLLLREQKDKVLKSIENIILNRKFFYFNLLKDEEISFNQIIMNNSISDDELSLLNYYYELFFNKKTDSIKNDFLLNFQQNTFVNDFCNDFFNEYHWATKKAICKNNGEFEPKNVNIYYDAQKKIQSLIINYSKIKKERILKILDEFSVKFEVFNRDDFIELIKNQKKQIQEDYEKFYNKIGEILYNKLSKILHQNFWNKCQKINGLNYNLKITNAIKSKLNEEDINNFINIEINKNWEVFILEIIDFFKD